MSIRITSIPEQKQVNGLDFPLVVEPDHPATANDQSAFHDWVVENKQPLHELLIKHGAVLFRGFPVPDANGFEAMLNRTNYENMPYVGGAAPRTQVTTSRIVTANESPASEKIPFHHEMAQVPTPPGYIFFYCDTAPSKGGATSILHSGEISQAFFQIDSDYAEHIKKTGVRYIRVMPEETDTGSAIGRSWKETFQATDHDSAEQEMENAGMTWQWLKDGSVRTVTKTLPAIRFDDETHQQVFFNSIIAVYTGWNDSRNKGETAVVDGEGQYMNREVMDQTVAAMDELCVNFAWQPGDVLWVNNHTVLHARQPYEGDRKILASIAIK